MSKYALTSAAALALVMCQLASPSGHAQRLAPGPRSVVIGSTAAKQAAQKTLDGLPLLFEENAGQSAPGVDYLARANGFEIFLTSQQAVFVGNTGAKRSYALRMKWLGSSTAPAMSGESEASARSNYFIGNDSSQWHTGIRNYARVHYAGIYPGVDLVYYGNHQHLEYDLTLAPGADVHSIRLQLAGAKKLHIDKPSGDLLVNDGAGEVRFRKPLIYQPEGDAQRAVSGGYVLSAQNTVSFSLGDYDHTKPLVIDPYVVYSTMFGGSTAGTDAGQTFYGMAVDGQGDVYLEGIVTTVNLPTTSGSFQPACNLYGAAQCSNFFVAKFDPTKSGAASLVYATYIGGSEEKVSIYNSDGSYYQMNDIAADSAGDAYFAGASSVSNYPTTTNAYYPACVAVPAQPCYGAGVLTKLDPTGSKLLYSTYIPATYDEEGVYPSGVAIDSSQIAYIAGGAGQDLATTDGSTCVGCYQSPFVAAIDTTKSGTSSLLYAEYVPLDALTALAADAAGNVYLGGEHYPTTQTWPGTILTIPLNGYQTTTTNSAGIGPYFLRMNHAGVATYSSYIGSGSTFGVTAIATDPGGVAYVGGNVTGPVTQLNGLPSATSYSGYDAFIAKVDTTQTGAASLLYATYLTGNVANAATVYGLAANGTGQVAFTGGTSNTLSFPETDPLTQPVAAPAYASTDGPFLGVLDTTKTGASALTFLSLVDGAQLSESIAFDPANNLIIGGYANAGSVQDPFLSVSASYQTSVGNLNSQPFFYKISLGSTATIIVSPSTLSFGNEVVNIKSASKPITVTNNGTTALTFSSITASSQFGETDNCAPSIAVNASCTVNVTFTPTATSAATGTLTLTDSDPSSPQTVSLGGTGIAGTPAVTLSPTALPFGSQTINTASSGNVVTLSNPGTATLTNLAISIAGANPTDFAQTNNCSSSLNAGASCNINVVFDPSSTGAQSASLSVADNATGSPQTVALTGTGTAPAAPVAALSPSTVAFANQASGSTSSPSSVTLSNTGNAALTISSITITGANPSDFAKTTTCGGSLAAGSSCTISVTFTPASAASFAATLSVADNATGTPQTVALTGTGTTPADFSVAVSPGTQSVAAGSSATYTVTVASTSGTFSQAVALSVAGLPTGATASFSPPSVNPGNGSVTSTLTVQTTTAQAMSHGSKFPGSPVVPTSAMASAFALFILLRLRRARNLGKKLLLGLVALATLGTAMSLSGCDRGIQLATHVQTYSLVVTGTSGSDSHATTVELAVE